MSWLGALLLALRATDILIVAVSGILAYWVRNGIAPIPAQETIAISFSVVLCLAIFNLGRAYPAKSAESIWTSSLRIIGYWLLAFLLLLAAAFMLKISQRFSRIWVGVWVLLAVAGFVMARVAIGVLVARARRCGRLSLRVAIIGADDLGLRLYRHLDTYGGDVEVVGVFDDRVDDLRGAAVRQGVSLLGQISDVVPWARQGRVDCVVVATPWSGDDHMLRIVEMLQTLSVDVHICPEGLGFTLDYFPVFRNSIAMTLGGLPMFTIIKRPLDGWSWVGKRVEDIALVILAAPVLVPLCLLIALAVKLDSPGPILFLQQRAGFNGRNFWVVKFRTMLGAACQPEGVTDAARRDDPRVTRIGYFLRRTSLDELPQFFNVLRGDMSVVGPRPHAIAHDQQFSRIIQQYYARQRVRPGITGWAQVHGFRGGIKADEDICRRVDYDLWYIENWSFLLDLRILLMTFFVGLINRNAY